jgi:hypothetical protein
MTVAILHHNNNIDPQAKVHPIVHKGRRSTHLTSASTSSMPSQLLVRARLLQRLKRKSPYTDNSKEDYNRHNVHREEEEEEEDELEDPVRNMHWMMPPRKRPLLRRQPSILGNLRRNYARRGNSAVTSESSKVSDSEDGTVSRRSVVYHRRTPSPSTNMYDRKVVSPAGSDYDEEDNDDDDVISTCHKRVHFSKYSLVKVIPHYSNYSMEERRAMWNGRKEIRRLAKKNSKEYNYEGCRAENAIEEQDFVDLNGTRIHPAHFAAPSAKPKFIRAKSYNAENEALHQVEL